MMPYSPHPVLFDFCFINLCSLKIYSYGLFYALGFLAAIMLSAKLAPRFKIKSKGMYDLGVWLIIGGVIGARLFYVIQFGGNFFYVWQGGLVFWGGFFGGVLAAFIFSRITKKSFLRIMDILAIVLPLGHAIGRIGCYFKGCCYGLPMENIMPWAVDYLGELRHPTQLYSIISNLAVFGTIYLISKSKKRFDGLLLASYLIIYPVARFIVEVFRDEPHVLYSLSIAQVTSIVMLIAGLALMAYFYSQSNKKQHKNKRNFRRRSGRRRKNA